MAYTISGVPSLTTTTQIGYDWFAGNDNYSFNIRVSIANETTGTTLVGSTVLTPGQGTGATSTQSGLASGTTYTLVMSIRRASNFELLGTRTAYVSTNVQLPSPPVWSSNFPSGSVNSSYSGSASVSSTDYVTWGFNTAPSIPGLSLSYNGSTGFTLSGTPTTSGTYSFDATATDSFNQSATLNSSITIAAPPAPSFSSNTFTTGKQGQAYPTSTITVSNTSGSQTIVTSVNSIAGLTITKTASSISLSGTPNISGGFSFTATAYGVADGGSENSTTTILNLTIDPILPAIWSDTSLSGDFRVGQSYAVTSGGNNTISAANSALFSIQSGSLPAGISGARSLSGTTATYTLTGTPTARGPYSFVIRASNTDGIANPDQTYSGNVTHPPLWVDETLGEFLQGRSYSDSVSVSTSTAVTWSVTGTVPVGISYASSGTNTNTVTFTGTPTGTGSYSFTVQATNSDGIISKTFSGSIKLVPNWVENNLSTFIQGLDYSDTVSATNSPTYSVSAGSLPTGISLNTSTGAVTGIATVLNQSYNFTITATNADGSVSQSYTGTVQPDLGGGIKVYNGTSWDNKLIHVYDGSSWVEGDLYTYNGSIWSKSVF